MKLLLLTLLALLTLSPTPVFAYSSQICKASVCTQAEVGVFMEGITAACGNNGDCTLDDIMLLFVNTGNYVVGIIGGIVLLMYVVGGVYFLTAAGSTERVNKGKKYLTISTIGLLIVMFSALGIFALRGVLQYGAVAIDDEGYVICSGSETKGDSCGLNMTCTQGGFVCESQCSQDFPPIVDANGLTTQQNVCMDIRKIDAANESGGAWYTSSSCATDLCPGDQYTQCCQQTRIDTD
ncbi:hypothetical protein HY631_02515 [Candidatus Uhrbacteria bacterium]|nr:hypothetical protein [Candidatus Uhrbacteria bacterium]